MFWFRANASVRTETSYLMPSYLQILNGGLVAEGGFEPPTKGL